MNDLTQFFPGCILNTEEIRETIKKILGSDICYCYKCFLLISPNSTSCKICYQLYCDDCARKIIIKDTRNINPKYCLYCEENRKFLAEQGFN